MTTRGRKRKPTALHLVAGNPGGRRLPQNEPKPTIEPPAPPRHLSTEARAEWARIVPTLLRLKLLSKLDRAALAAYCQAWAHHVEAEEQLAKASALAFTHNGYPIVNPWYTISKQSLDTMARFLSEFGFTPASRSRIAVGLDPDQSDEGDKNAFTFGD